MSFRTSVLIGIFTALINSVLVLLYQRYFSNMQPFFNSVVFGFLSGFLGHLAFLAIGAPRWINTSRN